MVTNALNAAVLITPSMEGAAQKRAGRSLFLSFYSPGSDYSLPVIGPCNYRPVITAVITVITAPCFSITCNWSSIAR